MSDGTQPTNITELFQDLPARQHMHVLVDDLNRALLEKNVEAATAAVNTLSRVIREAGAQVFSPSPAA